ncbi:hypothetical protein AaE_001224, partial [Aphanomyces astaci]
QIKCLYPELCSTVVAAREPQHQERVNGCIGKLDGNLTLVETIADNGGLNAAYLDYVRAVAEATKYPKETGDKLFWIRYG